MPKNFKDLSLWQQQKIKEINSIAEAAIKQPTPLRLAFEVKGIRLFIKDESQLITGSHKIRLARSLLIHAVTEGWINEKTRVLAELSSGSTARAEAYFAQKLGYAYYAVLDLKNTAEQKQTAIKDLGGKLIDKPSNDKTPIQDFIQARLMFLNYEKEQWHFIDQFKNASVAIDQDTNLYSPQEGNISLAQELSAQIKSPSFEVSYGKINLKYIVCGAGTGGTATTLGKHFNPSREKGKPQLVVVDPENSMFVSGFAEYHNLQPRPSVEPKPSRIEGIGRPRVEASFNPSVVSRMLMVPDNGSIAALKHFSSNPPVHYQSNAQIGGSSGTCLMGAYYLINEMLKNKEKGDIVTFIFDSGEYYQTTYHQADSRQWLIANNLNNFDRYIVSIGNILNGNYVEIENLGVNSLAAPLSVTQPLPSWPKQPSTYSLASLVSQSSVIAVKPANEDFIQKENAQPHVANSLLPNNRM